MLCDGIVGPTVGGTYGKRPKPDFNMEVTLFIECNWTVSQLSAIKEAGNDQWEMTKPYISYMYEHCILDNKARQQLFIFLNGSFMFNI